MKILDAVEVSMLLNEKGVRAGMHSVADFKYNLPKKEWVDEEFSKSFLSLKQYLNIDTWTAETNDCDDFARLAASLSQILHYKTAPAAETGLAFGEFYYIARNVVKGPHAINFFIATIDNKPELFFFEPQINRIIVLDQVEIGSCWFWKI